jgi:phosphoglycolate phosphatase-like HAD superfamily hydrolase
MPLEPVVSSTNLILVLILVGALLALIVALPWLAFRTWRDSRQPARYLTLQPAATAVAPVERGTEFKRLSFKQRRALAQQAGRDYKSARGYAHLTMLQDVQKRLQKELAESKQRMQQAQQQLASITSQQQDALRKLLERHLIHDRFEEVVGIGPAMKQRILLETNPHRLDDLQRARLVSGVGDARLAAIQQWVHARKQELPALLQKPFPGSDQLSQHYQLRIAGLQQEIQQCQQQLLQIEQRLQMLAPHIDSLKQVQPQTYVRAAQGDGHAQADVWRFSTGLFAEWEPVPSWFKEALAGESH